MRDLATTSPATQHAHTTHDLRTSLAPAISSQFFHVPYLRLSRYRSTFHAFVSFPAAAPGNNCCSASTSTAKNAADQLCIDQVSTLYLPYISTL